jgi:ERCC4-type nuclease
MEIVIDFRETDLIHACQQHLEKKTNRGDTISIVTENLPLGDILLRIRESKTTISIIERKTITDLLASIMDGRYSEQSYRLQHQTEVPIHHVMYMIEGFVNQGCGNDESKKKLVYGAITSLNYFKGFSVFRTYSVGETAEYLIYMSEKILRENHQSTPVSSVPRLLHQLEMNISML